MTVTHWLASCSLLCHTLVWKHFWKNWFHSSKRNSLFLLFQPLMRNTYLYLPKWKESGFLWWWRFIKDHNHTSLCIFKELKYIFSISLLITVVLQQQTEFLPCDSGLRYSNCFGSWALSTLADFWGDWKTRILTGTRKYFPPHTQTFFKENKTVRRRMIWCYRLRMMSTVTQLELLDSSPITM